MAALKNASKKCQPISPLLESDDHIEALLKAIYGDESYKRLSEEEIASMRLQQRPFYERLASLPSSDLEEMKEEDHGAEITCQFCQTTYNFDENDLEEPICDKFINTLYDWQMLRFPIVLF